MPQKINILAGPGGIYPGQRQSMDKKRRAVYQRRIDELKPLIDQDIQKCRDYKTDGTRPPEALLTTLREHWQRIVELFCVLYTRDDTGGTEGAKSE